MITGPLARSTTCIGLAQVGLLRPFPLILVVPWMGVYLVRCDSEPFAILAPEGKVHQGQEWV